MKDERGASGSSVHVGEDRPAEMAGQGIGGVGGAVLGGSFGAVAGPVGMIVGGIAGAVGGWWAGEKVARAASEWGEIDETHYREHHASLEDGVPRYQDARVGYAIGTLAGRNPRYRELPFVEVETDLRHGFRREHYDGDHGYDELRPYIREGFIHSRTTDAAEEAP